MTLCNQSRIQSLGPASPFDWNCNVSSEVYKTGHQCCSSSSDSLHVMLCSSQPFQSQTQMFKPCIGITHRMAPPPQPSAKQHGYVPLRAASPQRDGSTSREYPLNRRVSPGVEHRRPAPRINPKGAGKTPIAPGQVCFIAAWFQRLLAMLHATLLFIRTS